MSDRHSPEEAHRRTFWPVDVGSIQRNLLIFRLCEYIASSISECDRDFSRLPVFAFGEVVLDVVAVGPDKHGSVHGRPVGRSSVAFASDYLARSWMRNVNGYLLQGAVAFYADLDAVGGFGDDVPLGQLDSQE